MHLTTELVLWLPTLPTEGHDHGNLPHDVAVLEERVTLTGCQSCHTRLVHVSGCKTQFVDRVSCLVIAFQRIKGESLRRSYRLAVPWVGALGSSIPDLGSPKRKNHKSSSAETACPGLGHPTQKKDHQPSTRHG